MLAVPSAEQVAAVVPIVGVVGVLSCAPMLKEAEAEEIQLLELVAVTV